MLDENNHDESGEVTEPNTPSSSSSKINNENAAKDIEFNINDIVW